MRSHTPARCQARRRRQHVIPDPHPSSCGSICQGMPLRRTNKMPMRHARSETRGRPPFGRRGGVGKNGSTRSHNRSGSSAAAIPVHATSQTRITFDGFVRRSFSIKRGKSGCSRRFAPSNLVTNREIERRSIAITRAVCRIRRVPATTGIDPSRLRRQPFAAARWIDARGAAAEPHALNPSALGDCDPR